MNSMLLVVLRSMRRACFLLCLRGVRRGERGREVGVEEVREGKEEEKNATSTSTASF